MTKTEIEKLQEYAFDFYKREYENSLKMTLTYRLNRLIDKVRYVRFFIRTRIKDTLDVLLGKKYANDFNSYDYLDGDEL